MSVERLDVVWRVTPAAVTAALDGHVLVQATPTGLYTLNVDLLLGAS